MTSVFEAAKRAHLGTWFLFFGLSLSPGLASAQTSEAAQQEQLDAHTRTAARTLASQGAEAFERQDYEEAFDLFHRAGSLIEAPTIALMEARTLVALGRFVEAANQYSIAQLMNDPSQHNEAYQGAIVAAGQELEQLKPRIPLVKVELVGDLAEGEVEVWIDGRKLPEALIGVDNPLDPGRHRVEVRPRVGAPHAREFDVGEGEREALRFGTKAPPHAPAPPANPAPIRVAQPSDITDEPTGEPGTDEDTLPWILVGAGAAATAVGLATGIAALNKKSDLDAAGCNEGCDPKYKGDISAFRKYRTFSYLGLGLGLVGLGFGGYMLLSRDAGQGQVALWLTPSGAELNGSF